MFNVLKESHIMIINPFWELHDYLPPPGVIKPFPVPHMGGAICVAGPWGNSSAIRKVNDSGAEKSTMTCGDHALSRGHDIGYLIPHYNMIPIAPPNLLLALIIPFSGSKAYFGASKVLYEQGPAAFAVAGALNLNLNCSGATIPPLPSGMVFALPQTVHVGATFGDIFFGFYRMLFDSLVQYLLAQFFGGDNKFGKWFGNLGGRFLPGALGRFAGQGAEQLALRLAERFATKSQIYVIVGAQKVVQAILPTAIAMLVGSPVGYSPGLSPIGSGGYGFEDKAQDELGSGVDRLFDDPYVHTFD